MLCKSIERKKEEEKRKKEKEKNFTADQHTERAVNIPLVTEQTSKSLHAASR